MAGQNQGPGHGPANVDIVYFDTTHAAVLNAGNPTSAWFSPRAGRRFWPTVDATGVVAWHFERMSPVDGVARKVTGAGDATAFAYTGSYHEQMLDEEYGAKWRIVFDSGAGSLSGFISQ